MTAIALRALPLPDTDPPPENPIPSVRWARPPKQAGGGVQGTFALVLAAAGPGTTADQLRVTGHGERAGTSPDPSWAQETDEDNGFGPQATSTRDLPGASMWGRRLVQVVIEVMGGQRPASQLIRWTSREVYDDVRARTVPAPRPGTTTLRQRPWVSGFRVCEPVDGVAEICAVVHAQQRVQALALRLEGRDGRWQVTALETA